MRERGEVIAWAKHRALGYLDRGDCANALASMASDLSKFPDIGIAPDSLTSGFMLASRRDTDGLRNWIEEFA